MKWSQFILKFDTDNKKTLFNTYNKATVLLNIEDYDRINQYLKHNSYHFPVDIENIKSLHKLGFIIEEDYNEELNLYNKINDSSKSERFNVVLLTTTKCNFKCGYCYENGISRSYSFTHSEINIIIENINNYIKNYRYKEIQLTLFGGEPTVNWNFVSEFLPIFKKFCCEKEIELSIDIITNGYLLDKEKINTLLKYDLNGVQITLDGMPEIHNVRRPLINGNETFEKIIQNIDSLLLSSIRELTIRINYDKNNCDNISNLLRFLSLKFGEFKDKIKLSFGIIDSNTVNDNKSNLLINETDLEKYYLDFHKEVISLGFKINKYFEAGSLCMSKRDNSVIISPDNKVYKCLSLVGLNEGVVDNLKTGNTNLKNYLNWDVYKECFKNKCEFIPMCHTGCRFKSFVNHGNIINKDCSYELLRRINMGIIKDLYNL